MVSDRCITGHTAFIYDRGGLTRVGQIQDISSIQWERDRDGTSEATVILTGRSCQKQRRLINNLITKRHELVIFRGGERVWEGPLWRVGDEGDRVEIAAHDVSAYLFGTPLTRKWDNRMRATYNTEGDPVIIYSEPTEVTTRMEQIIEYQLTTNWTARSTWADAAVVPVIAWENLDPPANILPYLTVHHWPNEARTSAFTYAYEMTVGEHLAGFARSGGIDWTVVGRAIHIWDISRSLGRTRVVTEADFFGKVIVTEYGADHTQLAYVSGGTGQAVDVLPGGFQDPVFYYGEAVNRANIDLYGPWTRVYTAYDEEGTDEPNTAELNSQAVRNTKGRSPVPFEVRVPDNSSVRLGGSLSISDMVPGVQIPLQATLNSRTWSQMQKIDHVRVKENADGEDVAVTLTPTTSEDSDEEED
jgi:hypothetical protein